MNYFLNSFLASIIGAVLTYVFVRLQKHEDYKDDYYKKIIESRLSAYKLIEGLLATLSPQKNDTGDGKEPDFLILFWVSLPYYIRQRNLNLDKQFELKDYKGEVNYEIFYFELFRNDLAAALRQEAWLSSELILSLRDLFKYLADIYDAYSATLQSGRYRQAELQKVGQEHHERLLVMRGKIRSLFYRDTLTLHEVDAFIKEKFIEEKKKENKS